MLDMALWCNYDWEGPSSLLYISRDRTHHSTCREISRTRHGRSIVYSENVINMLWRWIFFVYFFRQRLVFWLNQLIICKSEKIKEEFGDDNFFRNNELYPKDCISDHRWKSHYHICSFINHYIWWFQGISNSIYIKLDDPIDFIIVRKNMSI